jgi:hypothetical protein
MRWEGRGSGLHEGKERGKFNLLWLLLTLTLLPVESYFLHTPLPLPVILTAPTNSTYLKFEQWSEESAGLRGRVQAAIINIMERVGAYTLDNPRAIWAGWVLMAASEQFNKMGRCVLRVLLGLHNGNGAR